MTAPFRTTITITTPVPVQSRTITRPCILVVDPDEVFLQYVKHALSRGFQVLTAHGPDEAAQVLRRGAFDLILVDLGIRLQDGIQLIEKIRAHSRLGQVPLLATATYGEVRTRLISAEPLELLPKSRWLDELGYAVEQAVLTSKADAARHARPMLRVRARRSSSSRKTAVRSID